MDAIRPEDDLTTVALKVATTLSRAGVSPVLTGGSAATVYAPEAYQSRDLDFVLRSAVSLSGPEAALFDIGFRPDGRVYASSETQLTVDLLPEGDVRIGSDQVSSFFEMRRGELNLTILTATDSVRDRLAGFFWFRDRGSLMAALAVARRNSVDLDLIQGWAESEGEAGRYAEFKRLLVGAEDQRHRLS